MKVNLNTKHSQNSDNFKHFSSVIESAEVGFFKFISEDRHLTEAKAIHEKFKNRSSFVQIGIGGSALGAQMLLDALGQSSTKFTFLDNTDPDYLAKEISKLDVKNSLFYVVSKSGGTAETIAGFILCYNALKEAGIKKEDMKDYFVFSTDPVKSELKDLAQKENYSMLEIPSNVGGRFSVLSSVGLLPALFAGINVDELMKGARNMQEEILAQKEQHSLFALGNEILRLNIQEGVTQTVLMPYSSLLKSFSNWFVQLWGESLGKVNDQNQSVGLTPIPAYGATDQHSQMQLFMEGPRDKFLMFLSVQNFKEELSLKSDLELDSAQKLAKHSVNELIAAQLKGTMKAFDDRKRPYALIEITENSALELGKLILFIESLTAYVGRELEIDPFNQPGVELGKKYAFEYLKA